MGKKHRNLIGRIADKDNLRESFRLASKERRETGGYLNFKEYSALEVHQLHHEILSGEYRPGKHTDFWVYEPKPRPISALPFRDRVVKHALNNVIAPIFEAGFLPQSHACQKGKGMHGGAIKTQALMRQIKRKHGQCYALKTDFSKYFKSISRELLWELYEKKISCRGTLALIEQFVPRRGYGIRIGELSSQLGANIIGNKADRYLAQSLKVPHFVRYMDDIVILHWSELYLRALQDYFEFFCETQARLFFSKWSVQSVERGVNFLGYRIWPNYKLLRKESVRRAKRKIKRYSDQGRADDLARFKASFLGHAQWADSHNLINSLQIGDSDVCTA